MRLTKKRNLTEIEQLIKDFPDFNETEHIVELTTEGKILNIQTKNNNLQKHLKQKGFTE